VVPDDDVADRSRTPTRRQTANVTQADAAGPTTYYQNDTSAAQNYSATVSTVEYI